MYESPSPNRSVQRKDRKAVARQDAERMKELYPNPLFWATNLEAKVNGVLKQVEQHFPPDHPLRKLITAQSEELSAFIYAGTDEGGSPLRRVLRNEAKAAKAKAQEAIVVPEGLVDARTALVWHPTDAEAIA